MANIKFSFKKIYSGVKEKSQKVTPVPCLWLTILKFLEWKI